MLGHVVEECAEVSSEINTVTKEIGKILRFGLDNRWPKWSLTNREKLVSELDDLVVACARLKDRLLERREDEATMVLPRAAAQDFIAATQGEADLGSVQVRSFVSGNNEAGVLFDIDGVGFVNRGALFPTEAAQLEERVRALLAKPWREVISVQVHSYDDRGDPVPPENCRAEVHIQGERFCSSEFTTREAAERKAIILRKILGLEE
jgi:hypothetical protein